MADVAVDVADEVLTRQRLALGVAPECVLAEASDAWWRQVRRLLTWPMRQWVARR